MQLQLKYEEHLDQHGVSLIAVTENYGNNHQAKLLKMISAWSAENDVLQISENVLRGQKARARECRHCGGTPPLGYDVNPETKQLVLAKNTKEIETVKMIFKLRSNHYTYKEILRTLEHHGLNHNKVGKPIAKTALLSILRNEKYTGTFVFNKSAAKDKHGHRNGHRTKDADEIIRIPGGCPQIIDDITFNIIQKIGKNTKNNKGIGQAKRDYLLVGLIQCTCGASYVATYRPERPGHCAYANYVCNDRQRKAPSQCSNRGISMIALDSSVIQCVEDIIHQEISLVTQYLEDNQTTLQRGQWQSLQEERESIEEKIKNISRAIADGFYDSVLQETLQSHISKKNDLIHKMKQIKEGITMEMKSPKVLDNLFKTTKVTLDSGNVREIRYQLMQIIKKITIEEKHVIITLKIPLVSTKDPFNIKITRENISNHQYDGYNQPNPVIL